MTWGVGADRCPFSMEKQLGQLVADDLGYSYRAYIENNLYYLPHPAPSVKTAVVTPSGYHFLPVSFCDMRCGIFCGFVPFYILDCHSISGGFRF